MKILIKSYRYDSGTYRWSWYCKECVNRDDFLEVGQNFSGSYHRLFPNEKFSPFEHCILGYQRHIVTWH